MISIDEIIKYGGYLIGAIVAMIFIVRQYKSGDSKMKLDSDRIRQEIIDNLKERNQQLIDEAKQLKESHERDRKDLQGQIIELGRKVGELSGSAQEKDKIIEAQNKTIENRNPRLEEVLNENVKTNKAIKELLEEILKQGVVMEKKTDEQTVMIKSQVKREDHIDQSTDAGTGNVMRKSK